MIEIVVSFLLLFTPISPPTPFHYAVAARCSGEASFAVPQCACAVKNRLDAGWAQGKVLNAFYAPDVRPTGEAVVASQLVLEGSIPCGKGLYYMLSSHDVEWLGMGLLEPALVVRDGGKEVRFYPRDAWKRRVKR